MGPRKFTDALMGKIRMARDDGAIDQPHPDVGPTTGELHEWRQLNDIQDLSSLLRSDHLCVDYL
jgi:hypothetical protein